MALYEIASKGKDGTIERGGIKAPLERVQEWIAANKEFDPECEFVAVPADENAITEAEAEAELEQMLEAI